MNDDPQDLPEIETATPQQMAVDESAEQLGLPYPLRLAPERTPERLAHLMSVGIAIDLESVFLDTIVDMIFTDEGKGALTEQYATNIEHVLSTAEATIARARLLQGL